VIDYNKPIHKMVKKKSVRVREYCQLILTKVSFSSTLFEKELRKALKNLTINQIERLKAWCWRKFWDKHPVVLQQVF
jgi:hypothetical protein